MQSAAVAHNSHKSLAYTFFIQSSARPFFGDASAAFGNDSDAASTTIAEVPVAVREVALLNENDWLITQNVIQILDLGSQDSAASHRVCLTHSGVKNREEACTRLNLNRDGFNF